MQKVWCSNPGHHRPKSVVTAPLLNARQQLWVSRVLGDDHYVLISPVIVGMANWKPQCQVSSWDENLQYLIGNGDVSIWVNFDRVRGDTKQLKHACLFFCSQVSELVIYWTISLVPRSFQLLQKLRKPILNNPPRAYSVFTSNWKNVEWCLSSFLGFNHHLFLS